MKAAFRNYLTVSKITFLSKTPGTVVLKQLSKHININKNSLRRFNLPTANTNITKNTFKEIDARNVRIIATIHLSAAFAETTKRMEIAFDVTSSVQHITMEIK
ncbi:hypothetical protein ElyMa_007068200 [Elysia marginata]|uniref:Uncharacterized protein n=1 Tax=Elysia marginata TaxID=1093978 RepID=A0AAV4JWZ5_9GAST|nr:hypothetical protein ElyMa_007068200 [Elysia marginata]